MMIRWSKPQWEPEEFPEVTTLYPSIRLVQEEINGVVYRGMIVSGGVPFAEKYFEFVADEEQEPPRRFQRWP